ncbi:MAG: hypothetical protein P1U58_15245 [Verrucomicrobiales bacterium]|nr:hypothetical protein [Verrucomicrobiales bacterium]
MGETLFDRHRLNEAILFRVGERFINEVEIDVLALIITIDRLQTGDVSDERGSCQTAEHNDTVAAFQFLLQGKSVALFVESRDIGKGFALEWHGAALSFWTAFLSGKGGANRSTEADK